MSTLMGRRRLGAVATLLTAMALTLGLTSCEAPPDTYVSLGDSYVSGPGIPVQGTDPAGCLRSDHNYPNVARPNLPVTKFVDVSCSGAKTVDFSNPQNVTPGPANAPQYNALSRADKIVTIGIGGNDIGFTSIIQTCVSKFVLQSECKSTYVHDGRDELRDRIAATAPKIDAVLAETARRAPRAKVFLVGYPTIVPEDRPGCPELPIAPGDVEYLRGVAKDLNAMLAARAADANATYVDTATSSIGHDLCAGLAKWVEGLVPTNPAAPVHPNAAGMRNTGTVVTYVVRSIVAN